MSWSDWTFGESQAVRYTEQSGYLVKETYQPNYNEIMENIRRERIEGQRRTFLGGYKVGSIPVNDLPFFYERYPEYKPGSGATAEDKKKALIRFSNDPEMAKYRIRKA